MERPGRHEFNMAANAKFQNLADSRKLFERELKQSKAERKILRKQNKAFQSLKAKAQEVGEISRDPTPYLLVKNGGLMCGVKRQDLFAIFNKYGTLEDVITLPGKSYSYASFLNVESAQKAMMDLNGQKIATLGHQMSLSGRVLYLVYLVKKPFVQLCSLDNSYPPGMILIEDFINESEESVLLQRFSSHQEKCKIKTTVERQLKHRYVKHFGYEFVYGSNTVNKENPLSDGMPPECLPVIKKIMTLDCVKHQPDQLTINEYLPGQGIPPHVDTHSAFEDGIISLSLGAEVTMEFRHPDGRRVSVLLPRRSILIMTEDSRYLWTHGITPRKFDVVNDDDVIGNESDRVTDQSCGNPQQRASTGVTILPREVRLSLTFRKVRRSPCNCNFPSHCDTQSRSKSQIKTDYVHSMLDRCPSLPQSEQDAIDLEKKHVYNVYDTIAEHFSGTRHSPWPKIADFLKIQPPGSLVADVGCGNGKYLGINDKLFMSGSDRSLNLATICRERGFQVIVCDILSLPYRSNAFDVCICIAVIHHLSTAARRLAALKELARIARPGGRILISVWALEQNLKNVKTVITPNVAEDYRDSDMVTKSPDNITHSTTSNMKKSCTLNDSSCFTALGTAQTEFSQKTSDKCFGDFSEVPPDKCSGDSSNVLPDKCSGDALKVGPGECSDESSKVQSDECSGDFSKVLSDEYCGNSSKVPSEECPGDSLKLPSDGISGGLSNVPLPKLKVSASRSVFEQQDLLVPWHYRGKKKTSKCDGRSCPEDTKGEVSHADMERVFQRFYHVYKEHELAEDCRKLSNICIVQNYYDKGNWCVELEKIDNNE